MLLTCELCLHTMSSSNMLMTIPYLSVNIAQLISPRNMKISPHGQSSTSLRSTLVKQKRLFFIDLLLGNIPPPLLGIERVTETTLLGIDITSTLSTSVYRLLMQINQRMYLLSQLKSHGMNVQALLTLFIGLIMSKITYALPSFSGQLTADDRNRIGAISRKAQRRGVSCTEFDITIR